MNGGMKFLVPFIIFGQGWQFYLAFIMGYEAYATETTWHLGTVAVLFLSLAIGNLVTTLDVYRRKTAKEPLVKMKRVRSSAAELRKLSDVNFKTM